MRTSAPLFKNFGFVGNAGKKLLTTTALTAAGLMALGGSAQADNWVDLTTTSGSTTTDLSQANTTNLNLNTQRAIVEGDLDINSNWTVNVSRGNLVAIDRENDPTFIFGHLNCAGSCHVIDANGVFVGASGSINAAAISLSDGELLNPAGFMAGGPVQLGNFSGAGIINQGTITVADAGIAAFVSPFVSNQGIINARMGKVVMAAGETVTLDLYGDNLFEIAVEGEVADALLENKGTINAEGGTVMMTAQAAKNAVDNVINMDGVIDVSSVTQKGGKIILSGGKKGVVNVSGKMDASGTDGGDVDVTGQNILVADTAEILVGGGKGNDGKGNGGDAYIYADNAAIFRGLILGRGGVNGGNGANAEVSGPYVEYTGLTNLLAYNGINGTLLLDPVDVKIQAGGAGVIPGTNVFDPTGLGNTTILGWDTIDTALGLGNLTITTTGNASQTNDGDIKVEASHLYSSANALNLFAHEAVRIDDGVSVINIGTGDITLLGGWNGSLASPGFDNSITDPNLGRVYFRAGSSVVTFGTLNLLGRNLIDMQAGSAAAATNVNMVSDQIVMDTSGSPALVNATDTVSISRNRTGDISLGADHGGLVLSQAEIANIGATTLEVGGATTDLTVDGVDTTTATISGTVFLSAAGDIEFDGANVFNALNATAGDDVLVDGGSSITTKTGGVSLTANNAVNDGLTVMQVEGTIDTTLAGAAGTVDLNANNHFVEIDPTGSVLTDGGKLTANSNVGFDIDNGATVSLGNGGAHINAPVVHLGDDIDTTGPITGTASTVDVENDDAEIQDGVDVAANNATVNVAAGTYNESVNVNKAGLKLLGNNAGTAGYDPRDPESIVTGGSPAFTVNADNITIDGFTMDGPTLTYGVLLNDVKGTKISNNIISRSSIAGIGGVVDHNNAPVGTLLVENNKIDDSNTGDGIKLWGDSAGENGKQALVGVKIDILGNEIGTDGDDTGSDDDGVSGNGIVFGQVGDDDGTIADGGTNVSAVINIKENDIAGLEGVRFDGSVDGATLDLSDNTDISGYVGDGVRFAGKVTSSSVTIAGNTEIGGFANGISFSGIDGGTVDILNNDSIRGYFVDGVSFGAGSPSISGGAFVTVAGNAIQGDVDGIYVEDDITGPGTKFWVGGNTITAGGDGVDIDHIENGAQANIGGVVPHDSASTSVNKGNVITAGGNGIEFDAGVDAIALVRNNRISAGDDGVNVRDGDPGHTTGVDSGAYVEISSNQIGSMGSDTIGDDGIDFDDSITGNATVLISGNAIGRSGAKVGDDGIDIDTVTGGATVSIINNTDIRAADNGIEISGPVNGGASVTISGNNHGIHADDHGIYFGSALSGGATVNIHDNIIGANEDHDSTGSGIWFDGTITSATVNIGDGAYGSFTGGASNIIRVDGNAGGSQSGLDGIHFDDDIGSGAVINIDGNRLGYFAFSVGGPLTEERLADDGIEFSGEIKGNADINITDNYIRAKGDGVRFSDKIRDFANVLIGGLGDNNAINAWHNGVSFLNDITGQSLVEISYNGITASNDGIYFGDKIDNAKTTGGISEQELLIKNNTIWGRNNGIHFNGEIDGERHDTRIAGNDIEGEDGQGIVFDDDIDEAHVRIVENTRIEGEKDGIRFLGDIEDGARVNIDDNAKIEGKDEEAIHFFRKVADSFVSIFSNDDIRAGENGIEFNGEIDNSTIVISENNHGIHADDHGILFTNSIHSGSDIDIHDNIISANEDNGSTGDGIHFGGNIYTATINIGDGGGSSFGSDPSNFIRGKDGIHFEGSLNKGSQIVIDGNRIGYGKTSGGSTYEDRVDDDGIQFDGEIRGNADVKITDNYIKSDDDGISFRNNVKDDARILIGGRYDGNTIDADGEGDGIQFEDKIEDHSLIEISHNSIYADRNGVVFNDDTSNHLHSGHEEEILIAYNTIDGDENGILFEGRASHALHDIVIRDNYKIRGDGKGDHGISFTGGIDDAELTIKHNDEIYGAEDGIHITGQFFNDAKIRIHGNTDIKGDNDDAIEVNDYGSDWGLDLEIDHNHAHWSGDNGIYVRNIENADIHDNTVHDVDGNGIYGSHIDNGNIASNTIYNTGGNGILVNPTDHIDIAYNTIHDVDEDGIRVDDGHGADIWGNHIGRTGDDGIDVNDNDYVDIWDNYIHDTGRDSEHGDGISVDNSYRAEIKKNRITGAGRDGINVKDSNKTVIGWNKIFAEGGNYYYHDYGQEGAGRDGIHVENSDDLLVIGNDVTADLGYGHKGAIDRLGAGRHGIYVEGGKDIDIMYNHILGDSEHRRHYYNSVDSVGEDGIHVTAAEDILIKKNEVSRAGDDGIEVIVGNVEERREIRLGITSIRDRGRHEDDTNKVIIIGNEVSRSGDDGIVVTTEQDYDRREENKGPGVQSFGSQGGNDWDDNRSDGKKLFIKIADNDVEKSGDDGIEVNLKTSAGNNDNNNFPGPVGFLQQEEGFGGFGGHHDRPDNEILISDNNVSKSGDDGIVVKIAPKEEKNG
ncbi:MAG: right-handed parallel beta-helix repeat-containing protein, partial [Alphaproteobacteria bacterium]|nr:right-handed parallel beta-helix repeat-containing protein [Alphaproteobacteria bacterium]